MLLNRLLVLLLSVLAFNSCMKQTSQKQFTTPEDANLWPIYTPASTQWKLWSPEAEQVQLLLYPDGTSNQAIARHNLSASESGVWALTLDGDWKNTYYTFQVKWEGEWLPETPGIYAQATGVNGERACIIDHNELNPSDWSDDAWVMLEAPNKAILYELHVRDMTIHPSSGSKYPGKYLGLAEKGTKSPQGLATGIDHLIELGITHVHLLPVFDYLSVDEERLNEAQFNWGYDPQNYNVPEGSYSTNPHDAAVRIREFKQMVRELHRHGIGVVMDVVYNHTGRTEDSNFNREYPEYYYRFEPDGRYSNASGCGNETASEKPMVRKFMLESILYWAKEYHIDGFRFDLMGIHDIETMNLIADTLKAINPSSIIYGEGWTGGSSPLAEEFRAVKKQVSRLHGISAFSDDLRDGLKGSVFEDSSRGFVSGVFSQEESIKFGVVGSILHDQLLYKKVNYSDTSWAVEPWQSIAYVSCHDNHTLYDKLKLSNPNADEESIVQMQALAIGIVLTSQGIPFLHAGSEFLRTKNGEHNSYNLSDAINQIDWNRKADYLNHFQFIKQLIQFRKEHPSLTLPNAGSVRKSLNFLDSEAGVVAYTISSKQGNEPKKKILVVYNAKRETAKLKLDASYQVALQGLNPGTTTVGTSSNSFVIAPKSLLIAVSGK